MRFHVQVDRAQGMGSVGYKCGLDLEVRVTKYQKLCHRCSSSLGPVKLLWNWTPETFQHSQIGVKHTAMIVMPVSSTASLCSFSCVHNYNVSARMHHACRHRTVMHMCCIVMQIRPYNACGNTVIMHNIANCICFDRNISACMVTRHLYDDTVSA